MNKQQSKPDYWRVQVIADGEPETEELLLVLKQPNDFFEPVECTIRCASESEYASMLRLQSKDDLTIRGHQSDVSGEKVATLEIESARILRSGVMSHGSEHKEWESSIHCDSTTVRWPLKKGSADDVHSLLFVSDNYWLAPPPVEMPNSDGSLDAPEIYSDLRVTFELDSLDAIAELVHVYDWQSFDGQLIRNRHFAVKVPRIDIGESNQLRDLVYGEVDDFLLLTGLATANYGQCVGFVSNGSVATAVSYRRDRVITNKAGRQSNADEAIVNVGELDKFWSPTYRNFCASEFKDEIRTCLHTLRASKDAYLEPSFLMKFAALELLLSRHRDLRGISRILDERQWKALRKDLSKVISAQVEFDKESRTAFHSNLSQLNRLPLRTVFEDFVTQYGLDLKGIWPMFDSASHGLATVRNLMVHGATETKDNRFLPALSIADVHLLWILEVVLLALLQWPRSSTNRREKALNVLFCGVSDPERVARAQDDISELAQSSR
jgi:hypothetical protein